MPIFLHGVFFAFSRPRGLGDSFRGARSGLPVIRLEDIANIIAKELMINEGSVN
jgi:hypothetical protein